LIPPQTVAFEGLLIAFTNAYGMEVFIFYVSFDRYALHLLVCKIVRWAAYLVPEEKATPQKKFEISKSCRGFERRSQ
jgi:hypothetical protein